MRRRWAVLWLLWGVEEVYSTGLRRSNRQLHQEDNESDLQPAFVENGIITFLEANMKQDFQMSMDTKPPTPSPITEAPTPSPVTEAPTLSPRQVPTPSPTQAPTPSQTQVPTPSPIQVPTPSPTQAPTSAPMTPTPAPITPTSAPITPTSAPLTDLPSARPTTPSPPVAPVAPISFPTEAPTESPFATETPTASPVATEAPTASPVDTEGTASPVDTLVPTASPILVTLAPVTSMPVADPTLAPVTSAPTSLPTTSPTRSPTVAPSGIPTSIPSASPTIKCNLSEEERASLILSFLETVSPGGDLNMTGTPQNLAATWLIEEDMAYLCPLDPTLIQRYSMAVFYYSTKGNNWAECQAPTSFSSVASIEAANDACDLNVTGNPLPVDAWLTPSSECDWGGAACNADGFIERIDFEKNLIGGTLPSEISRFMSLKYLLIEEGLLSGVIPTAIGFLDELEVIDLNFNKISGPLPESLYRLSNLQQLDLNDNEIDGTISTQINRLSQLLFFQVQNNQLSGTIPGQLGNLFLLEIANFEGNQLQGSMPDSVCANRTGLIRQLTADCLGAPTRPSPPFVDCSCCTTCY